MTLRIFTDRSRILCAQDCGRRRFLNYHQDHRGIESLRKPLPLVVGGSIHVGLEHLLLGEGEDTAVMAALVDFSSHSTVLELDTFELNAMQPIAQVGEKMAESLGLPTDHPDVQAIVEQAAHNRSAFDSYLQREQAALVEAMVRAYARRRLRPLLEQFEVLEVEREGEWLLSEFFMPEDPHKPIDNSAQLWFMSRPDALLRERESNQLYLLSFKTAASWDVRKERDAQHDMQGLSEGVEVERRLARWWEALQPAGDDREMMIIAAKLETSHPMARYLKSVSAPPRIHAIRYEYLLKGDRRIDKDLTARYGMEVRAQQSHLVSRYEAVSSPSKGKNAASFDIGDVCWSWNFIRPEDMSASVLAWQNWKRRPAWESPGGIKAWIDLLDSAAPLMSGEDSTTGMEPRELGWQCDAQKMGVTREHPLDAIFIPPVVVYRNEDDLRDWIDSTEYQERVIAEHVAEVAACEDEGDRRHLLNMYFPMSRSRCEYPSSCPYIKICYAGEDMKRSPLESGQFKVREVNHPQELGEGKP